jgi:cytochrome oxidase Cu insertion factor (SCO1/SenC/PrrC family)
MKLNSPNPENQNPAKSDALLAAPIESSGLTGRELLGALGLGLTIAVVAGGVVWFSSSREKTASAPTSLDRPRQLVEFNLTDRSGRSVSQGDLAGKFLVVNFVFTGCSLSCRAVNDRMEEIQGLVAAAPDVQLVSLTVDPRTDTPAVLAKFADRFHADTNRWLFLTGEKAELYRLIETSFIPKSDELEGLIPGGFTNTDRIMLVDPQGKVCASFNGLSRGVARAVTTDIEQRRKSLLKQL